MTITNKVSNKSVMPGVTPVADVVDAPTIGTATDSGDGTTASVPFTASATGGTATSFTAVSTPSSITGSSASSPISVTGLSTGTAYTFKVYGANASGTWSAVQSAASNSLTLAVPPAFYSIATVTVGAGGASSADFTSIPGTYTHLQIRYMTYASNGSYLSMQFNGDTASNYHWHQMNGDGASVTAGDGGSDTRIALPRGSSTANTFGIGVIDIFNYANTNMNKTTRAFGGRDVNGSGGYVDYLSGLWVSTSAITSIKLYHASLTLPQYCTYALYGVKA